MRSNTRAGTTDLNLTSVLEIVPIRALVTRAQKASLQDWMCAITRDCKTGLADMVKVMITRDGAASPDDTEVDSLTRDRIAPFQITMSASVTRDALAHLEDPSRVIARCRQQSNFLRGQNSYSVVISEDMIFSFIFNLLDERL